MDVLNRMVILWRTLDLFVWPAAVISVEQHDMNIARNPLTRQEFFRQGLISDGFGWQDSEWVLAVDIKG